MEVLRRRLAVARGDEPADLVVRGGRVLSVFTKEWLETDVAIVDGVVAGLGDYEGEEALDASGKHVVPGFIDAHMHLESVKLMVDEFARLVLPLGTTTVVADPHEIANVLGVDGVHWLLDASAGLQLDVFFMASSCVPASQFESPRRPLGPGDLESLMRRRRVLGLAEMMNFPGVISGSPAELEKLLLEGAEHVDGHAPGVLGKELQAYAAAGIETDHEALTVEEGRERLRAGMWLLIREASMARNLLDLLPLVQELGTDRIAFCTDDRDPEDIADDGHVNGMVRTAVEAGHRAGGRDRHGVAEPGPLPPAEAPRRHRPGVPRGPARPPRPRRLRPGDRVEERPADRGHAAGRGPRLGATEHPRAPRLGRGLRGRLRRVEHPRHRPRHRPGRHGVARPRAGGVSGQAVADAAHDLAKIAVVERHLATGRTGLGFVSGSGLQRGALASSVAHDAHNLVVVGMSDEDMAFAVERLVEIGGGIVAVDSGQVLAECPLPIAGLLSDAPLADVVAQSRACNEAAHGLGWTGATPFLTLSFLGLSVIPHLKITDRGLVDVDRFEIVPLEA